MSSPISQLPSLGGAFSTLGASDWFEPQPPDHHPAPRRPAHEPTQPTQSVPFVQSVVHEVDWRLVVTLRRTCAEQISHLSERWLKERGTPIPADDRRVSGRAVIRQVVHNHAERLSEEGEALWPLALEDRYAAAVENAIFGYGRLQPLFEIPDAENIEIHGWDSVMIQYGDGHREPHPPVADSDEELVDAIRFLGETANPPRPFDDAHPTMTLGDLRNQMTRNDTHAPATCSPDELELFPFLDVRVRHP